MAVILIGMTIYRAPPEWAIWVFVIGQLCDAFLMASAPAAGLYPNDDKPVGGANRARFRIIEMSTSLTSF